MGIVIRSKVTSFGYSFCSWEYSIYEHPSKRKEVCRADAMRYIADNGLVDVYRDRDGQIYDTPDQAFLREFRGYFENKSARELKERREKMVELTLLRVEKRRSRS